MIGFYRISHGKMIAKSLKPAGLIMDSTGFPKLEGHAEGRFASLKDVNRIVANDENYALAA